MSRRSLESAERPIMAPSVNSKRTSTTTNPRPFSTYSTSFMVSGSPSFHNQATSGNLASTTSTTSLETTGIREINHLTDGLKRLENKPLAQQRFVMGQRKGDEMSKLALGAKVERALGRRMKDQDAVFRRKDKNTEKQASEIKA